MFLMLTISAPNNITLAAFNMFITCKGMNF